MKSQILLLVASCALFGCASHAPRTPAAEAAAPALVAPADSGFLPTTKNGQPWNAKDPTLKRGDLTVWKLQEMAQKGQFAELNELFNHGLTLDSLPVGYSAGTGAPVPQINGKLVAGTFAARVLEGLTGANWRGKIFYDSQDAFESHGMNRILKIPPGHNVLPTASFKTYLLEPSREQSVFDQPELANGITSNFVVLNYAHPQLGGLNRPVEWLLTKVQVFDVMVAVPGKYGPLYVGKTWLGKYGAKDAFHAFVEGQLLAWYFLDFNDEALTEQMASHWGSGKETRIDFVDKKR